MAIDFTSAPPFRIVLQPDLSTSLSLVFSPISVTYGTGDINESIGVVSSLVTFRYQDMNDFISAMAAIRSEAVAVITAL